MLSLATTRSEISNKSLYRISLLFFSGVIFSIHLHKFVFPRVSRGVGYDPMFRESKGNLFIGYFQTYRISASVKEIVRNALNQVEKNLLISKANSSQLLMHLRFGDYRNEPTFGLLTPEYFSNGLRSLESEGAINIITVFSDEPQEALKLIPAQYLSRIEVAEVAEESPLITLCRMRGYKRYIIANSTFSWWAAYTSEATSVYVPDPWFATGENPVDLIPGNWNKTSRG
jgi:hypothetical protein